MLHWSQHASCYTGIKSDDLSVTWTDTQWEKLFSLLFMTDKMLL